MEVVPRLASPGDDLPLTVDPDRWRQVNEIFARVVEAPENERSERLRALTGHDPDLASEVESLLRADAAAQTSAEPFLKRALAEPPDEDDPVEGQQIGPYRLSRQIGRGGMGLVYLAERTDEFRMTVAIKIVRGGLGESLRVRFNRERQILASLDHPNIAKLLDGGATPGGSPYLVMEYVDGEPITKFCDKEGLETTARLRLFEKVCAAIHHAHRHLIIHRDLKPGNILVTREGVPKLLDFGVAKLLDPAENADGQTLTGVHPMTPAYASPEQASGQPITTATDIYSLGVILFELLTGARPYQITSTSPLEIQKTLLETQPAAPSRLKPGLSTDLDSIVAMAMRKEPDRRYVSAAALADDVRRHLNNFPILARPDTRRYRMGRFVRRHKAMVVGAALAGLALTAASAVALWQARVARTERALSERRFSDARKIANSMVFELHDEMVEIPGATKARGVLMSRASEWLDTLARDAPDDPDLLAELAEAYDRLGQVLGGAGISNLGQVETSLAVQRKSHALRQRLAAQAPGDQKHLDRLARSHIDLAYALGSGDEARAHAESAVRVSAELAKQEPENKGFKNRLAQSHFVEGFVRVLSGDLSGGERAYRLAGEIFEKAVLEGPDEGAVQRSVSLVNKRLGAIMLVQTRLKEAQTHYERALAMDQKLFDRAPQSVEARFDLSVSHVEMAGVRRRSGDPRGAMTHLGRALTLRRQLLKEDPANARARQMLVSVLSRFSAVHEDLGEFGRSLELLSEARGLLANRSTPYEKESLVEVLGGLARAYRGLKRSGEACQAYGEAVRVAEELKPGRTPAEIEKLLKNAVGDPLPCAPGR